MPRFKRNARGEMPFLDHLEELRWRLIWSLLALTIGFVVGFVVVDQLDVLGLLMRPIAPRLPGGKLYFTSPIEPFMITLKLGFFVGVVLASPVYRASFPGVLKNLLDQLPVEALRNKPVGIVAMGGSPHHYLAVDGHLRLVLAWFGALVAPSSVYLTGKDFTDGRLASPDATADLTALGRTLVALTEAVHGRDLGPTPLAARFS